MQIAFYIAKNGTLLDKIIAIFTFSKYSHCELVFPSGEFGSSSARDGGVRLKLIKQNSHWDIFDLKNVDGEEFTDKQKEIIKYWFHTNDDQTYDWLGAISSRFCIDLTSDTRKFCSNTCALMLGINSVVTPQKLYEDLISYNMIK